MNTKETLNADLKQAMRDKDSRKLTVLRAVKAAIVNKEKLLRGEIDSDEQVTTIIRNQIKQREDSYEQFSNAGRVALAANEEEEIRILAGYLPAELSAGELEAIVKSAINKHQATSRKQMGLVMKDVNAEVAGRADGKTISQMVMSKLG